MFVCAWVRASVCVRACACVCMYVYVYVCVHVCVCTRACAGGYSHVRQQFELIIKRDCNVAPECRRCLGRGLDLSVTLQRHNSEPLTSLFSGFNWQRQELTQNPDDSRPRVF